MRRILLIIFCGMNLIATAQEDSIKNSAKGYDPTKLFIGGSLTVSLGGYQNGLLIGVNPYIGYAFKSWIDAGVAINYQHYAEKDLYDNKYRSNTIGLGLFTRIYPIDVIFLQIQPEYNFTTIRYLQQGVAGLRQNFNAESLLLGAGYKSSRGEDNNFTYFSLLVDVLKKENSPYVDAEGDLIPIIRAGINITLGGGRSRGRR